MYPELNSTEHLREILDSCGNNFWKNCVHPFSIVPKMRLFEAGVVALGVTMPTKMCYTDFPLICHLFVHKDVVSQICFMHHETHPLLCVEIVQLFFPLLVQFFFEQMKTASVNKSDKLPVANC